MTDKKTLKDSDFLRGVADELEPYPTVASQWLLDGLRRIASRLEALEKVAGGNGHTITVDHNQNTFVPCADEFQARCTCGWLGSIVRSSFQCDQSARDHLANGKDSQ